MLLLGDFINDSLVISQSSIQIRGLEAVSWHFRKKTQASIHVLGKTDRAIDFAFIGRVKCLFETLDTAESNCY